MNLVLLPGLDGTGQLFERFLGAAPANLSVLRIALPDDRVLSYDALADFVQPSLPTGRLVLVGESFSGPLALRLALRVRAAAVILCASFVRVSVPSRLAAAPLSFLLRVTPPASVVKYLLCGGDTALANDLVDAVRTVDTSVIASRVRMVLEVDATSDLRAFSGRVLYLRATRDHVVSGRQAELLREARSDAVVTEIDGPHLLLQTRPEDCWSSITAFLAPEAAR